MGVTHDASSHLECTRHLRIDDNAVRPVIVGWAETTFWRRLEGTAIREFRDISRLMMECPLKQSMAWHCLQHTSLFITALTSVASSLSEPNIDWYTANYSDKVNHTDNAHKSITPDLQYLVATELYRLIVIGSLPSAKSLNIRDILETTG